MLQVNYISIQLEKILIKREKNIQKINRASVAYWIVSNICVCVITKGEEEEYRKKYNLKI